MFIGSAMAGLAISELLKIVNESPECPINTLLDRLADHVSGGTTTLLVPVHLAAERPEMDVQVSFAVAQLI